MLTNKLSADNKGPVDNRDHIRVIYQIVAAEVRGTDKGLEKNPRTASVIRGRKMIATEGDRMLPL